MTDTSKSQRLMATNQQDGAHPTKHGVPQRTCETRLSIGCVVIRKRGKGPGIQEEGITMAYFSNGTEGEAFEETHCYQCKHYDTEKTCPVMEIHLNWNYEQLDDPVKKSAMEQFIPIDKDGYAGKCRMFISMETTPGGK